MKLLQVVWNFPDTVMRPFDMYYFYWPVREAVSRGWDAEVLTFHACRNRSCPQCHGEQTRAWLEKRQAEMLPCPYFHVTVTVPEELRAALRTHLRDGYGTEPVMIGCGGNIHVTQRYGLHADPRTTRRYTLAAVAPELKQAAAALAQRPAGQLSALPIDRNGIAAAYFPEESELAHKRARAIGALVVTVPVVADYRQVGDRDG